MATSAVHNLANAKLFDVSSVTAVISGGGTGLGQMMAEALCSNGSKVYIIGRRKEPLDAVVEQYGSKGPGQIIALPGDISSKTDLQRLAEELEKKEPKVSFCVDAMFVPSLNLCMRENSMFLSLCELNGCPAAITKPLSSNFCGRVPSLILRLCNNILCWTL